MRGEGAPACTRPCLRRITPACAGRSKPKSRRQSFEGDHPRVCGEKKVIVCNAVVPAGSPPRVRGEVIPCFTVWGARRITPACAGRRGPQASCAAVPQDHPRVCGEKVLLVSKSGSMGGSPPRVRGEGGNTEDLHVRNGITPACAGRNLLWQSHASPETDHPRVCGEKPPSNTGRRRNPGSPPRVRGEGDRLTHLCTT